MTGRELIIYILSNELENGTVYINDIEMTNENLDWRTETICEDGNETDHDVTLITI